MIGNLQLLQKQMNPHNTHAPSFFLFLFLRLISIRWRRIQDMFGPRLLECGLVRVYALCAALFCSSQLYSQALSHVPPLYRSNGFARAGLTIHSKYGSAPPQYLNHPIVHMSRKILLSKIYSRPFTLCGSRLYTTLGSTLENQCHDALEVPASSGGSPARYDRTSLRPRTILG